MHLGALDFFHALFVKSFFHVNKHFLICHVFILFIILIRWLVSIRSFQNNFCTVYQLREYRYHIDYIT